MLTTFAERLLQSGTVVERMQNYGCQCWSDSAKISMYTGPYGGGFTRTPYFCSLKLILSLNIKC